ncbi:MAG: hypothetical protein R2878_02370 [Thermoleophilia bacterium]
MDTTHRITEVADDGDAILYHCEECLRQVVVRRSGGLTVLQQGDFFATHVGGHGPIELSISGE